MVTGASSGIGRFIAETASNNGVEVIGLSRNTVEANFESIKCDITDPNAVKTIFKTLKRKTSFNCLINTAGIASMNLFLSTPIEKMDEILKTNILGTMYCSQQALKIFARRKDSLHSSIINFSTIAVPLSLKGESVYVASKGAVEAFSRSLAREASDFNCNVNVVSPGPVDTNLISKISEEKIQRIIDRQIIQNKATKEDIWNICNFLMSQESSSITGQIFNVKGA